MTSLDAEDGPWIQFRAPDTSEDDGGGASPSPTPSHEPYADPLQILQAPPEHRARLLSDHLRWMAEDLDIDLPSKTAPPSDAETEGPWSKYAPTPAAPTGEPVADTTMCLCGTALEPERRGLYDALTSVGRSVNSSREIRRGDPHRAAVH
jgi:hypothetical protein